MSYSDSGIIKVLRLKHNFKLFINSWKCQGNDKEIVLGKH